MMIGMSTFCNYCVIKESNLLVQYLSAATSTT